ncbi:Mechanosensitive ion channel-domain-containing protein [Dactylonectria macrodidyma]|uniref:Mechanosensitive ion channel-domain-containing protein n=1 Tax=Dactylonectria macrodidyma TaxID=307937 RepID=A0A9P9F8G0_9HYPO|nr:Mechanosensitive ion channel-domain-containing protein [Dactylonectria macrodidyma]
MVNRNASLSPRNSGFIQLGGARDMADGIQLTTVKSNASIKSSHTGHRKAGPNSNTFDTESRVENEKSGHHGHRGRRRKLDEDGLSRSNTGDEASLNAMGRLYNKIVGFSVVTRYLVYVVPVSLLLAVPIIVLAVMDKKEEPRVGAVSTSKSSTKDHGPSLYDVFLWVQIMWLSLWAAKVVAWFLPGAFMFFCGVVSMGTRKYATVLSNLILPFSFFFWALGSYVTFQALFKDFRSSFKKGDTTADPVVWCQNMSRVLGALFVSSAVFLGEKAIVQLIGISYHQRSFANRIKASKREIHLLGLLYDASRTLFPMYCPEFADEDYVINDSIEMMLRGKKSHKRSGSATPMRLIGDVGRIGDKVTSVFGNIASEITGKQVFNPNSAHSIVLEALEKKTSSEALARRIWMSFVVENHNSLVVDDFQEVLGPAYKDEAEEAFYAIDNDENGDISLDEMVIKVTEMGTERKAIGEGMKDIGQALRVFDKVLLFLVLLIVIFIFLIFFKSTFVTTLTAAGTTLLSLSFVFAVTCQEFLGSCIFLFVKHPYDVGDRVEITATTMVVNKISLLYTVFHRGNNQVVQIPNIQLNNLWIENVSRSKSMSETIEVNVSFDTTFEDIELLRLEMEKFVRAPENSRDFQPELKIDVGGVGDLDKLLLKVDIKHKSNWHNAAVRANRRSKFMCALALALKKVPINAPGGGGEPLGGPTNPTYSVAVSDEFASKSRGDAEKDKDAARLVPTRSKEPSQESEKAAIQELGTRHVAPENAAPWDNRDDLTLGSDDQNRHRDVETLRHSLKRDSTRGRRKAGETLPGLSLETPPRPSISVRHPSPRSPMRSPFDEEAETGMGATPYHSNLSAGPSGGSAGYQSYGSANSGSQVNVPNPLQPTASQQKGPPKGQPPAGQH